MNRLFTKIASKTIIRIFFCFYPREKKLKLFVSEQDIVAFALHILLCVTRSKIATDEKNYEKNSHHQVIKKEIY